MRNLGIRNILCSLVCALFTAGIGSAQTVLYVPQFVDGVQAGGPGWITAIAVTNPAFYGTSMATGTITVTDASGTPMNITLTDVDGHPGNTFQLTGAQTKFFISPQDNADGPLPFKMGYATVTSNLPVSAEAVLFEFETQKGATIATAGVPASAPLTRQAIVAVGSKDEGLGTGLAIANPGGAPVNLLFQLLDKSGAPIVPGGVTRTLPAGNHQAFFISDLFPTAPPSYFGTLRILSDKGIVTTALLFQGATFGTVPVIPLP
jgi:hypothetical protein